MDQLPFFIPASLSVSELTRYLRGLLESDDILRSVWVRGEISNFSRPSSGHLYFTLKDSGAALRCVVWRSTAMRIRFGVQNGLAVEAHGAVSLYERDGQYQLYVDAIRPAGEGLLYQEFLRLKTRLEGEGLFETERKRPIPDRPQCIGVITSPTGAALQDILNTLRTRYPLVEVVISPCSVQGETAPEEIVRAIQLVCQHSQPDLLILARGGGSLEDLWAFNDERVVRAIVAAPVPVITGVGHETDVTLADFASDLRAPTPTGAAVLATPNRADLQSELQGLADRLHNGMLISIARRQQDLDHIRQRLDWTSPAGRIRNERQQLDETLDRGFRAFRHNLQLRQVNLMGLNRRLTSLNPSGILQRGYALIQRSDGSLLFKAGQAKVGESVEVRMQDGSLTARVEDIEINDSANGGRNAKGD